MALAGNLTVEITAERDTPQANPKNPLFMKGITFDASHIAQWNSTVLPYIQELTFKVASTTDVYWFGEMLRSQALPGFPHSITRLDMPGFHWFSGITDNRTANPYLVLASHLPDLQEVSFTMHTASITTSMWGERQMIELEATDLVDSQARRVLSLRDICAKYGLDMIFRCSKLRRIRLVYIKSDMVTANTQTMDPENLIIAIRNWLASEFLAQQQHVSVTFSQAP